MNRWVTQQTIPAILTSTNKHDTHSRALFASGPGEASWFDKAKGAKEAGMDVTHVVCLVRYYMQMDDEREGVWTGKEARCLPSPPSPDPRLLTHPHVRTHGHSDSPAAPPTRSWPPPSPN